MNKSNVISFVVGLLIGGSAAGAGTYLYLKKKHKKDLEIVFDNWSDSIDEEKSFDDIPNEYRRQSNDEPRKLTPEEKEKIREKLKYNNEQTTNYARMYLHTLPAGDIVDVMSENDSKWANEVSMMENEDEEDPNTPSNIFTESEKSKRAPRIVKESDVDSDESWGHIDLYLYSNGVLANEEDREINDDEKETMLGDCLTKYDFINSEEKYLYVQCFSMNTFYTVHKFDKPFNR